jgi:hypothetical protein
MTKRVLGCVAMSMVVFTACGGAAECARDADCKGARVCTRGACVDPGASGGSGSSAPGAGGGAASGGGTAAGGGAGSGGSCCINGAFHACATSAAFQQCSGFDVGACLAACNPMDFMCPAQ